MENLHISQGVFQIVRFRTYHIPSLAASLPRAFILIQSHLKADESRVHIVSMTADLHIQLSSGHSHLNGGGESGVTL